MLVEGDRPPVGQHGRGIVRRPGLEHPATTISRRNSQPGPKAIIANISSHLGCLSVNATLTIWERSSITLSVFLNLRPHPPCIILIIVVLYCSSLVQTLRLGFWLRPRPKLYIKQYGLKSLLMLGHFDI